jgi:predicted MFS family arabinose efflux permease
MAGTLVFALTPPSRCWVPLGGSRHWLGPLQSNGLLGLLAALLFSGGSIGALNLFVVSYAERYQIPGGAGLCLALNAVGALIGALAYGSVSWRMSLRSRLGLTTVSMAVAYWCLTLTPEPSWMAGLMVMTGIFLAPTLAVGFSLVTQVSPQGSVTEAFAWLVTTFTVGSALGSLCAGAVISGGLGRAATVAAVAATCSAAVACGGRALWPERTEPGFVGSVGA